MAKISDQELAEQYGFTAAMLDAIPDLRRIFKQAVAATWSVDKFQAKIRTTGWWKSHDQSERDYLIKQYTDPATARQELAQAQSKARALFEQLGGTYSAYTKKKINELAYNIAAKGWNDQQARYQLGQYVYFGAKSHPGGEAEQAWEQLHQVMYAMGIKWSDQWAANTARDIIRGKSTIDDAKAAIAKAAKAAFPQWAKEIDSGQTVADLASPYLQSMSKILEIPPGSVNMFDPTIRKAMGYKDKQGKAAVKPIWQFENELRSDPRWAKTQNAQDSVMSIAHNVLQSFGFRS